jgi:DNA-binding beta-propeller fold protein YncE
MEGEVNGMRALLAVSAAVFLVAGCGSLTPIVGGGYKVYAAASNSNSMQVAVIDSHSHAIERKLEIGTPSGDWKHFYSIVSNSLLDTNPETGGTQRTLPLRRHYELPRATMSGVPGGMSQNGKWLVLEAWDRDALNVATATHLLLVDTSFASQPVPVELKGNFDFDAISNNGQNLFLIEYLAPQKYRVRLYRVGLKALDENIVVEKGKSQTSTMAGVKLMSVPSPDGEWLYTLYAQQNEGAFIHGLQLNGNPFAACVDLPGEGYAKDPNAFRWSIAISPKGSTVYAANGANGIISEVSIGGSNSWPSLIRTTKIGSPQTASNFLVKDVEAKEFGSNTTVVSPDGKTLITAGGTGLFWVDTANMQARAMALDGWRIWSLGLSPDGKTLYALNDSGNIAEVSMASNTVGAKFNPSAGYPIAIMRVAAA